MPPKGPEYTLQQQVLELAALLGWQTFGVRGAWDKRRGFSTPTIGTLAKGWLDLTLFRDTTRSGRRHRDLMFVELKSDIGRLSDEQKATIEFLSMFAGTYTSATISDVTNIVAVSPGVWDVLSIGVYVWRPRDFDLIERMLR